MKKRPRNDKKTSDFVTDCAQFNGLEPPTTFELFAGAAFVRS